MRTHGNLTRWNDERGFGFITTPKGEEIFVHISAFPPALRPQVGELVSFETEIDDRNRTRAIRIMRPAKKREPASQEKVGRPSRRSLGSWLTLGAVAALAVYGYSRLADYNKYPASIAPPAISTEGIPVERAASAPAFQCDGRKRCPEMRSCEEAKFFLRNCPGTTMDGDGDGVPCEDQWCGH